MAKSLVIVDNVDMTAEGLEHLRSSVADVVIHDGDPQSQDEVLKRLAGATSAILTWRTKLAAAMLDQLPDLEFIAIAASPFLDPAACNVDLAKAAERGIAVSMLAQYGDEATAEWILWRMLSAARQEIRWRKQPTELFGKRLGVVGMGHMGGHIAKRAAGLGMDVVYNSRERKPDVDALGYQYLLLPELLKTSDVVTVHVAKGVTALDADAVGCLKSDALLINTSIGPTIDVAAAKVWLAQNNGAAFIADSVVAPEQQALSSTLPNAYCGTDVAAATAEMRVRKTEQLVENVKAWVAGSPIRLAEA